MFDFNDHFNKFNSNIFYENITYSDLLKDISIFGSLISESKICALKFKSPYLVIVGMIACIAQNKTAILISHLDSNEAIKLKKKQIHFDHILEDHHFDRSRISSTFQFQPLIQDNVSLVIFSSGSTSAPKGVALSFNNIYYSAIGFSEFFNQTQKDRSLINLPHHHVGGLMTLWRAFFSGGSLTTNETEKVDFISMVPLQLKRFLADNIKLNYLKKIRVILVGGAPLSTELNDEALKHGLHIYETYGMTETTSLVTANGVCLPYREISLDKNNFFIVKGKTLSAGYFKDNIFIKNETDHLKTSDKGKLDQLEKFHFIERTDLIFISGGENINPLTIEETLKKIPEIKDVCLTSIKDENWGEIGILLYELRQPQSLIIDDLKLKIKNLIHPHHVPKFLFEIKLQYQGQLKAKRNELKELANLLYLKEIFYYDFIKNDNKPTIVFFHGFLGSKDDLKEIGEIFKNDYSLLFIDMPGHGKTKIENFSSYNDILSKLSSFIKIFESSPIYYGYSMGGRIALQLAINYLRPQKLILESAGLGLENALEQGDRLISDSKLFENIEQKDISRFLSKWYSQPMFKEFKEHASFKQRCENKYNHSINQWRDSQNYLSQGCFPLMHTNLEKLKEFPSIQIIYIYGENDLKYKSYAKEIQSINGQIAAIKGAGHNPHITHLFEIKDYLTFTLK